NETMVLVATSSELYAVDRLTGGLLWSIDAPSPPSASPAVDADRAYVGCQNGSLYALNLKEVRRLHAERLLPLWSRRAVDWRFQTSGPIYQQPLTNGFIVNFASNDGALNAVTAVDRKQVFRFETDAPVSAPISVYDGQMFIATDDFNLYSVNMTTG